MTAGPYCAICPTNPPTQSPTPTLSSFAGTGELRNAVVAAQAAGADCNAAVYQTYGPMNAWDVSRITNLDSVFSGMQGPSFCTTAGLNLNNWNVSRVTSMTGMSQAFITSHIPVLGHCP